MRYLLNSAVITAPGTYRYRLITVDEAKQWVSEGEFISTIGYPETAEALRRITGVDIPVNRTAVKMEPGDEALVFRLAFKPGDPRPDVAFKGQLGVEWILERCEFGLLERIDSGKIRGR